MIRAALVGLLLAGPAAAADPADAARRAAAALETAAAEMAAAERRSDRVAALTSAVRAYEDGLAALRGGMRDAAAREAAIRAGFDAESARLAQLLGALMTLGAAPEVSLLLHPDGAVGTARAGMILSDVTPALRAEVADLRADLDELAMLMALQESAASTLETGLAGIEAARLALSAAIADRTDMPRRATEDPAVLGALIDSVETLAGFASGLADLPPDPAAPALPDFAAARGDLPLPVAGRLLRGYGAADAAGIRRSGILLEVAPGALVVAPWPGTVRYAGPLLDYGNVMVLEPEGGFLLVLAGLGMVYGAPGEILPAGAPVGLMGGRDPALPAASAEDGQALRETLYIELRVGQDPVDPAPWFRETLE
ncbi:peptidase M23 [Rhodobacteraceae bacterium CCMM004]|nr:peptidase M23 [Rhodobacteraceae bacterium CCMM004]